MSQAKEVILMRYNVTIEGMGCEHCVNSVKNALSEIGANSLNVEIGSAQFDFDGSEGEVSSAIENVGFDVTAIKGQK